MSGRVSFNEQDEQLAALALRHAVPTVYQYRPFAAAGGLLSYGSDETECPVSGILLLCENNTSSI